MSIVVILGILLAVIMACSLVIGLCTWVFVEAMRNDRSTASRRPMAPAGWYPDPSCRAGLRYWNGAAWTEETAQPGSAETP